MAFTTWAALKTSILDDMADGSVLTKAYGVEGRTRTFQDLRQVMDFLKLIDANIDAEAGKITYAQFDRPGAGVV